MASDDGQPDGGPATPADLERVQALVSALLDGWLGDEGRDTLEGLVVRHRAAATQYLRSIHLNCVLQLQMGIAHPESTAAGLALAGDDEASSAADALHETMVLPAIRDPEDAAAAPAAPASPLPEGPLPIQSPAEPRRWKGGAWAAALVVGGMTLAWAVHARRPPAVLTATADALAPDGSPLLPGARIAAGRSLHLTSGAAELTFDSGAVLVARAPAVLRVIDGNAVALTAGSATAHVPQRAVGFRVDAPGLSVVDRGTDFGVRVSDAPSGTDAAAGPGPTTEVEVLAGRVDATVIGNGGSRAGTVQVDAGQAVRHVRGSTDVVPAPVPFAAAGFDLDIATMRIAVPTHGTGAGVAPGAVDPNWQVTPPSPASTSAVAPAFAVEGLLRDYAPNAPDAQWISIAAKSRDAAGGRYVYHTTVDLTGFDPATVSASARGAADDAIAAILVNGEMAGRFTGSGAHRSWWSDRRVCAVSGHWHEGVNQVDVWVDNAAGAGSPGGSPNFTGLQCALDLTAVPLVRR